LSGLTWLGHSTVVIDVDGTRLVTDPVLRRRVWHLRRESAMDPGPVDAILVSHGHFDHLDRASLRRFERSVPVVAPRGLGRLLRRSGFARVHVDCHIDLQSASPWQTVSLEALLDGSPNPNARTVREAVDAALTPLERERFLAELADSYAAGPPARRHAAAYLVARK